MSRRTKSDAAPRTCDRGHPRPAHHSDKAACLECAYEEGRALRAVCDFAAKADTPVTPLPANYEMRDFHGAVVARLSVPKRLSRARRRR